MTESKEPGFFGAFTNLQSYSNVLYLLLGLPFGIAYFVFLVTGLSLGFGLIITLAGIPVLLAVLAGSWVLCGVERRVTVSMLDEDIEVPVKLPTTPGMWPRLKSHLSNRLTWTGMLYLFLRFPLGIGTFTMAVTLIAVSVSLVFAPVYAWTSDPVEWNWTWFGDEWPLFGGSHLDPFKWSWILTIVGIPVTFLSMFIMNKTAFVSGRLAKAMLGKLS